MLKHRGKKTKEIINSSSSYSSIMQSSSYLNLQAGSFHAPFGPNFRPLPHRSSMWHHERLLG